MSTLKLPDPPARGILRKSLKPGVKKSVRFDLPYVVNAADLQGLIPPGAAKLKSDVDDEKPKVFIPHSAVSTQPNKSSQYLGLELYQYYSTLCSKHGIQPWEKVLNQIKV